MDTLDFGITIKTYPLGKIDKRTLHIRNGYMPALEHHSEIFEISKPPDIRGKIYMISIDLF